jgi:HlyD family secretion protein
LYAYQQYTAEAEQDELGELSTVVADLRDITVSVSATGVLQPIKIVEIRSKASGEILEMPVEMGDYLNAGDLIAQIDTRILDQELKQADADFESAQIRLDISQRQLQRAESLHAQDLISENDLETSKQNFTNAESQFIRAEASLELARERLADATVRAPIAGRVLSKSVEQGQIIASSTNNVSGGTVMLTMADLSELEIRTLVDEIDIGSVKPGLRVESTVEAFSDMSFEGAVIKIEPQAVVQQSVTTFPVLSRIDNGEGLLLPGMNADVSIIMHERSSVLTVANEAVRSVADGEEVIRLLGLANLPEDGRVTLAAGVASTGPEDPGATGWQADGVRRDAGVVFALSADGTIVPRRVVTGVRDWEIAEVLDGLEQGDELVLLPSTSLLRSQQSVRERFARRNAMVPGAGR